jgi:hypothetical protein
MGKGSFITKMSKKYYSVKNGKYMNIWILK